MTLHTLALISLILSLSYIVSFILVGLDVGSEHARSNPTVALIGLASSVFTLWTLFTIVF